MKRVGLAEDGVIVSVEIWPESKAVKKPYYHDPAVNIGWVVVGAVVQAPPEPEEEAPAPEEEETPSE